MNQEAASAGGERAESIDVRRVTEVGAVKKAEPLFDKPIDVASTEKFLAAEGHHLLLAYAGALPVGMVTGVEMTHPDKGTEMFIYELGVEEAYRGRGIGSRLVSELAEIAKRRGCYGMWTLTEQDNTAAKAAYERAGGRHEDDESMFTWEFGSASSQ